MCTKEPICPRISQSLNHSYVSQFLQSHASNFYNTLQYWKWQMQMNWFYNVLHPTYNKFYDFLDLLTLTLLYLMLSYYNHPNTINLWLFHSQWSLALEMHRIRLTKPIQELLTSFVLATLAFWVERTLDVVCFVHDVHNPVRKCELESECYQSKLNVPLELLISIRRCRIDQQRNQMHSGSLSKIRFQIPFIHDIIAF